MPIHDAYARRTPLERVLPDEVFAANRFPAIEREAQTRQVELIDPGVFGVLETAGEAVDELRLPDAREPEMLRAYALVLFHLFHHDRAGRPLVLARTGAVRAAVRAGGVQDAAGPAGEPAGEAGSAGAPPAGELRSGGGLPACAYVQLPQHLVWTGSSAEGSAGAVQSVDGFFWTDPGDGSLHVMAVAGLIEGAPGLTVFSVPGIPAEARAGVDEWIDEPMRSSGADFAADLPGAELDELIQLRTAGELLKLAIGLDRLARLASLEPGNRVGAAGEPPSPAPSDLAYHILDLD